MTLKNVNINASDNYAGITCLGDAEITLVGTNTVNGCPGIFVPIDDTNNTMYTLTINGNGSLNASSNGDGAAGIGGGSGSDFCGDIVILGGTIVATGGQNAAGIGGGSAVGDYYNGSITISGGSVTATGGEGAPGIGAGGNGTSCGDIIINGGSVTATGGKYAAGIGTGYSSYCQSITITDNVTKVTATKGEESPNSIGPGKDGYVGGKVTIGGTVYMNINAYQGDGAEYLAQSPLEYQP